MSVRDDVVVEGAESFRVTMTTDNPLVVIPTPSATVNIVDNDCKKIYNLIYCVSCADVSNVYLVGVLIWRFGWQILLKITKFFWWTQRHCYLMFPPAPPSSCGCVLHSKLLPFLASRHHDI